MPRTPEPEAAAKLVSAVAAQDFDRLEELFAPEIRFRALIPRGLREDATAVDAAARLRSWFGDGDPLELVESETEQVADRLHVRYRFRSFEEGRWHLVEQHLFCDVAEDGRIAAIDLVCSGFRPVD